MKKTRWQCEKLLERKKKRKGYLSILFIFDHLSFHSCFCKTAHVIFIVNQI